MVRVDLRFFIWKSDCDLKLKKKGGGGEASLRSEAIMVLKIFPLVPFEF